MCHSSRKNRLWHYLLALVVAGLPLAVMAPCLCGESTDGEHCCEVDNVCQLAGQCSPAKPCCCQEEMQRQSITSTAKTDKKVRQAVLLPTDFDSDSLLSQRQGRFDHSCEAIFFPSLRLHAVLGVWLN